MRAIVAADWILARTKPQQEQRAATNLHRQGQTYYLPQIWNHKMKRRQPLFVSYIFVLIRRGDPFSFLHSTFGIAQLIMFAGVPGTVPAHIIEHIRKAENKNGCIELPGSFKVEAGLQKGEKVEVLDGPFRGLYAIYEGMSAKRRVEVLMSILGNETRVELDAEIVRRAA